MKIVSFNVNSVRLRLHQLQALADAHDPDVIGLQETKVVDDDFPVEAIREIGYESVFTGQKTHYGVAMLSKTPLRDVRFGFASDGPDAQKRLVGATVASAKGTDIRVINGYFPQGENRKHDTKFPAKERIYADLLAQLETDHSPDEHIAVIGDFNVAPVDADIGLEEAAKKRWLRAGSTSFLPEEREWIGRLTSWGLDDSYRVKYPEREDLHSWFDYRSRGFEREPKRGLRIDHLFTTAPMTAALVDSGIDENIRAMEKPSDHCPVWSSFAV